MLSEHNSVSETDHLSVKQNDLEATSHFMQCSAALGAAEAVQVRGCKGEAHTSRSKKMNCYACDFS